MMLRDSEGGKSLRLGRIVGVLVLSVHAAGCASRRPIPGRAGWMSKGSPLGSDLRAAPRGVTIPAPSVGVDLVGYSEGKR